MQVPSALSRETKVELEFDPISSHQSHLVAISKEFLEPSISGLLRFYDVNEMISEIMTLITARRDIRYAT